MTSKERAALRAQANSPPDGAENFFMDKRAGPW